MSTSFVWTFLLTHKQGDSLLTHPQHLEPFLPASSPIMGAYSASPLVAPYLALESRAKALLLASRSEADMPPDVAGSKMSSFDNDNTTQFLLHDHDECPYLRIAVSFNDAIGKGDANMRGRALNTDRVQICNKCSST